jgi:hypothetical protein
MSTTDIPQPSSEQTPSENLDWALGFRVLGELLKENDGFVSSTALRRELEQNHHVEDARPLVIALKFFDPESSRERGIPAPDFKFRHLERSFYSEERYREERKRLEEDTTKEAEDASDKASEAEPEEPQVSRTYRQEEARLVAYVKRALEEIYSSDLNSEEKDYVFDVHSLRKGSSFENVDLIAVHWLPHDMCELVSVEVKLDFNPQVVQQALNYCRFSHRAWVAVPVDTDSYVELREKNPTLFEYAISRGLGLLACRRRRGKSYEVFPVHWPARNTPDVLDKEEFVERYRDEFEEAGIAEPRTKKRPPRLR